MTLTQKQQITVMRRGGTSYGKIAATLRISENTIKAYCRRNNLSACRSVAQPERAEAGDKCPNCGSSLTHTPGAKRKRFCSDKCRLAWWKDHPEAVKRKAVYHFTCATCGTAFESYGNNHRRYCSRACFASTRRRTV